MKKNELTTGQVVEVRNGKRMMVLKGSDQKDRVAHEDGRLFLEDFYENMTYHGFSNDEQWDIVKVFAYTGSYLPDINTHHSKLNLLWELLPVKEMTVEEISEKLGYEVKIVGGN